MVVNVDGDRDNDGIVDSKDVCPDLAEDNDGFQDDDGCPDFDNDNDGIQDAKDKCPSESEDKDGFEDQDGCPDNDNDKDGIPDARDNCPDVAGDANRNGCPFKAPAKIEDNFILEGVTFRTGSAEITEDSYQNLDQVYESLAKYNDRKYEIAGHTDNTSTDKINIKLSLDRANAVREYLINRGIEAGRLVGKGYGSSRPKADNKTAAGRSLNRRIEFYRIKK
jgi:outer membrane protein OmpA-like peptidoglycan-associated protein